MGIVVQQSARYALVAYIGVAIGALTNLILMPAFLLPDDIGVFRQILANASLLSAIVLWGMSHVVDRFHPYFSGVRQDALFSLSLLHVLVFFAFLCGLALGLGTAYVGLYSMHSPHVAEYFFYLLPILFLMACQTLLEGWVRVHLRIVVPALLRDVWLKLSIAVAVLGVGLCWWQLHGLFVVVLVYYVLAVVVLWIYLRRLYTFRLFPTGWWQSLKGQLLPMYRYAVVVLLGGLSMVFVSQADILMLGMLLGEADTGIYTIAFFMANVIEVPRRAVSQITTPLIARAWAACDYELLQQLYQRSAINQLWVGGVLFLLIWSNHEEVFRLMPNGSLYRAGIGVVFWIGLARFIDMAMGVNNEILLQSRYYAFALWSNLLLALLVVLSNIWLIPRMGLVGAALATFLSVFVYNFLRTIFLWLKLGLHPFGLRFGLSFVFLLLIGWGLMHLPLFGAELWYQAVVNVLLRSCLLLGACIGILWFFRPSEELHAILLGLRRYLSWQR